MREIKFRAWDIDEGCWIPQVDFAVLADKDKVGPDFLSFDMRKNQYLGDCIPIVIEQFTGLLDKNGADIYEGDIVRVGDYDEGVWIDDDVHAINYQGTDGYPAFELTPHPGHEMNGLAYVFQSGEQDIEVIGNIHQNPELLET